MVFVPSVPRKVERVHVTLGAEPNGPALTLSGSDLELAVSVSASNIGLIKPGDAVQIDDEGLGIDMPGIVATTAATAGTEGAVPGTYAVRVRPTGERPERLLGANVRVRIPVDSTKGEVLAVPVAAVWAAADGSSRVRLAKGGERTEDVAVRVGLAAEGFVEVEPLNKTFGPGDEVVLGAR